MDIAIIDLVLGSLAVVGLIASLVARRDRRAAFRASPGVRPPSAARRATTR